MTNNLWQQSIEYLPDFAWVLNSNGDLARNTWSASLSSGKALEFLVLLALQDRIKKSNANCTVDNFFKVHPDLYYSRNEIPYHHGAQSGHNVAYSDSLPSLEDRFLAATLPRATFCIAGKNYMLFREGCPLHILNTVFLGRPLYNERPDLIVVEGKIDLLEISKQKLYFKHCSVSGDAEITLSVKNTNLIPLHDYTMSEDYCVSVNSIYEISVSKTSNIANKQLSAYQSIYSSEDISPDCFFINGDKAKSKFNTLNIDITKLPHSLFDELANNFFNRSLKGLL